MSPHEKLIFYSVLLSVIATYAWWVHFRVWIFRQDLFLIRDRLWDQALLAGELDNPHHRAARDALNGFIRLAPYLSVSSLAMFLLSEEKGAGSAGVASAGAAPKAVEDARLALIRRIRRFLLAETITGICGCVILGLMVSPKMAMKQVNKWVSQIVDSKEVWESDIRGCPRNAILST